MIGPVLLAGNTQFSGDARLELPELQMRKALQTRSRQCQCSAWEQGKRAFEVC